MNRIIFPGLIALGCVLSQTASAQFRCPDHCPRGNCVKVCPLGAPPTCSDYCADALHNVKSSSQSPQNDLVLTIPDATPEVAAKIRKLLGGKSD